MKAVRKLVKLVSIALVLIATAAQAQEFHPNRVTLTFDHFYTYDEMSKNLHDLTAAYPELLSIQSIGKSYEGRDLWLVTINNPKTGPHTTKPAMYIDGNIHGNEVQCSEVGLYTIWYLTKSYGKVEMLTELLDESVFYILPMVNPDGRSLWFDQPNGSSSCRSGNKPLDNDRDGLFDEDGPEDLDGDGEILQMRRRTPNGRYKDSPVDPRLMTRCKPGEKGQYERLGREGIDNDGDGRINEDGVGGYDMNRNWPADWQPNYIQRGAGDYPLSYPEPRAIAEFIFAHPNIAGVQAYHNAGGMILRGPGQKYVGEYPREDLAVYDHIGKKGEKILPFYRYMTLWKDLYPVHGGFVTWTAESLGIISFTNELWTANKMFYAESKGGYFGRQEDRLQYNDLLLFGQIYRDWKPFKHPVYGDVELGGWVKMSSRVPPGFMLTEMCHRNAAFTIFHARAMPKVEFLGAEVRKLDGGLFELTVEVTNQHMIPTVTALATRRKIGARDYIEIKSADGSAIEVVAGGTLSNRFTAPLAFVEHQPWRIWNARGLKGEQPRLYRWILRGGGKVKVTYWSQKATEVSTTVDLQ